ncbi:MAG: glycosyltransferase family 4 protein [Candidatus Hydrogenedentes bacterium]|nr:glycosyltransferase family 4 protein [Candidatus Hydrogenedentota bacterium]
MKVVYLVPGSGGTFYCQNCMRDLAMVRALRRRGHDVLMVPLYLPSLEVEDAASGDTPVFFGGINVYLQERFGLFRHTPRWLDTLFDLPLLLKCAAKREGSTKAAGLGSMTLSMLKGRNGHQKKELDRLITWLADREHPDIVHISNALLIGVAAEIKRTLHTPVVCSLQDEDGWLDALDPPYNKLCWRTISELAADIDLFISVSHWYADFMAGRMGVSPESIRTAHIGIDIAETGDPNIPFDPPVIGYLSKMTESLGLGTLVDAFIELKRKPGLDGIKLRATGGITGSDKRFVAELKNRLANEGMDGDADFLDRFDDDARNRFLQSISVLSVPTKRPEAFGTYLIEAMAHGVPVVQPAVGAFPELIESTGGGLLYDAKEPTALETALESLLRDENRARELGRRGYVAVRDRFSVDTMADCVADIYEEVVSA